MRERDMAEKNLILKVVTGSHLYGTHSPESDRDYLGIFIPDRDYVLGMKRCEQVEFNTNPSSSGKKNTSQDVDCTLYSLPKFIHLAAQNNPNVLEVLFAPDHCLITCTDLGRRLREAAPLFVSKRIEHTFLGFARSQRYKLENKKYEGSRLQVVVKYGYDVKYAYHLIRLLYEGLQIAREKELVLPIPTREREILIQIKQGKKPLEEVLQLSYNLEAELKALVTSSDCTLSQTSNFEGLNYLQMAMLEEFWQCK